MSRKSWVYTPDGRSFEKGSPEHYEYLGSKTGAPMIIGDNEEFVSPIDQKLYRGRAGMREHNKKHDVVSNRDLVGLPFMKTATEYVPDRRAIRESILQAAKSKGYMS